MDNEVWEFLVSALVVVSLSATAAADPAFNSFSHPRCGFSITYPSTWEIVSKDANTQDCIVTLRPRDFDTRMAAFDVDVNSLTVRSGLGDFAVGAEEAGFALIDPDTRPEDLSKGEARHIGERVIYGRHSMITLPDPLESDGYQGLRGTVTAGCFHEQGGYAGLCDLPLAFLTDGQRWVEIRGGPQSEIFDLVLNSICLYSPSN